MKCKTPLPSSLLEDEPELAELIKKYVLKYPQMVSDLKKVFKGKDTASFEMKLHDIKSTGGNYGFMPIADIAVMIEKQLDNGNHVEINSLLDELSELSPRMELALD